MCNCFIKKSLVSFLVPNLPFSNNSNPILKSLDPYGVLFISYKPAEVINQIRLSESNFHRKSGKAFLFMICKKKKNIKNKLLINSNCIIAIDNQLSRAAWPCPEKGNKFAETLTKRRSCFCSVARGAAVSILGVKVCQLS